MSRMVSGRRIAQVVAVLLENGARTGTQPWARLHAEGHGTYWAASAGYIDRHLATWRQALR